MASPAPEPPTTGIVALDYARRTLSVIIADHATDIPYSTDAFSRLAKLLPRNTRTFDNMNQVSQVADHFLLRSPKWKSAYDDEACALYHTIFEGLDRLHIKEEIHRIILRKNGRVWVNNKIRDKRLLKVEGDVERLLEIMLEIERDRTRVNPTSSSTSRHHIQPVWVDEQTKIPNDELAE